MSNNLFALYGTELEELDEEKGAIVSRKPTAIQDQIVTDERGRRRFHGAFTGGFSAGYFNSVGSKEGWTPQEFKSSRDQRATRFQQMAEDLMDEEDLGEYGIGQRRIRQSENFLSGGSEKRRMAWEHDSTTLSNHLKSIVQPVSDSVGTRMLRAMGWREGRGIGLPISKKHQRKVEDEHETESDFDREQIARIAPQFELTQEDVLISYLEPVEGVHGLGYEGLRPTTVLDQSYGKMASTLKIEEKSRGIRGQAFGVGAFEDEDENVYSQYDLSQFNFALDGPEIESETATVDVTFLQMTKRLNSRTFYAPPKLPPNFKPTHRSVILNSDKLPDGLREAMKNMTVIQRAKLLGEDRTSVMELVNDKDRKKLVSRTHRSRWDQRESSNKDDSDKDRLVFSDEPMKQARFKEFLKYLRRGLVFPQPNGMSVWEWEAEKKDFEAALTSEERGMLPEVRSRSQPLAKSSLALPIQELLQNKFTKETGNLPQTGHRDEDKLSAVRIGMFGERTRTSFKWYPDNLLAKRFNVPNPYPDVDIVGVPQLQKMNRKETILNLGLPNTANELLFRREGKSHRIKKEEELEENIAGKQREETEKEVEKPPVSVFDAIFGNSSSSDTEKEEEEEEREKDIQIESQREGVEVMKNNDESKTADSSVSKKIITVMDLDEEFGPPPPPGDNQALSGFSMLRYLKEELDRKKARRANHKKHKSKKLKKERKTKSKKSRKEKKSKSEKRKKNRHNQSESSSDESSSDCNNA